MALSMWRRIAAPAASGSCARIALEHEGVLLDRPGHGPGDVLGEAAGIGDQHAHGVEHGRVDAVVARARDRRVERVVGGAHRRRRSRGRARRRAAQRAISAICSSVALSAAHAEVSASSSRRNAHRSSTASSLRRAERVSESRAFTLSIPITVAPRPGLTSTRPSVTSACTASRTEFRPTPYSCHQHLLGRQAVAGAELARADPLQDSRADRLAECLSAELHLDQGYTCDRLCPIVGTNKNRPSCQLRLDLGSRRNRARRAAEVLEPAAGRAISTPPRSGRAAASVPSAAAAPSIAAPSAEASGSASTWRGRPRAARRASRHGASPAPRPATATAPAPEPVCASATARTSASLRQTPSTTACARSAGPCSEPTPRTTARTSVRQTGARSPERYGTNTGAWSGSADAARASTSAVVTAQQTGEPLDRGAARLGRPVVDGEGCARRRAARVAADRPGAPGTS